MTEVPATSRRRERGRAPRSTGPSLTALPRLINRWAPLEILTAERGERVQPEPFEAIPLLVGALFGDEADDE